MTTDLFKKDYRQLKAQGIELTPEDIVRLNALAVKVSLSRKAASNAHLPRAAFLPRLGWRHGEIVLREPTIAHELWLEQVSSYVNVYDERNFYFVHGYMLSRPAERLPDAFRARRVIRKVFTFAAKRLALYTHDQLSAAVDYVLFGADWKTGEHGPADSKSNNPNNRTIRTIEQSEQSNNRTIRMRLHRPRPHRRMPCDSPADHARRSPPDDGLRTRRGDSAGKAAGRQVRRRRLAQSGDGRIRAGEKRNQEAVQGSPGTNPSGELTAIIQTSPKRAMSATDSTTNPSATSRTSPAKFCSRLSGVLFMAGV